MKNLVISTVLTSTITTSAMAQHVEVPEGFAPQYDWAEQHGVPNHLDTNFYTLWAEVIGEDGRKGVLAGAIMPSATGLKVPGLNMNSEFPHWIKFVVSHFSLYKDGVDKLGFPRGLITQDVLDNIKNNLGVEPKLKLYPVTPEKKEFHEVFFTDGKYDAFFNNAGYNLKINSSDNLILNEQLQPVEVDGSIINVVGNNVWNLLRYNNQNGLELQLFNFMSAKTNLPFDEGFNWGQDDEVPGEFNGWGYMVRQQFRGFGNLKVDNKYYMITKANVVLEHEWGFRAPNPFSSTPQEKYCIDNFSPSENSNRVDTFCPDIVSNSWEHHWDMQVVACVNQDGSLNKNCDLVNTNILAYRDYNLFEQLSIQKQNTCGADNYHSVEFTALDGEGELSETGCYYNKKIQITSSERDINLVGETLDLVEMKKIAGLFRGWKESPMTIFSGTIDGQKVIGRAFAESFNRDCVSLTQ